MKIIKWKWQRLIKNRTMFKIRHLNRSLYSLTNIRKKKKNTNTHSALYCAIKFIHNTGSVSFFLYINARNSFFPSFYTQGSFWKRKYLFDKTSALALFSSSVTAIYSLTLPSHKYRTRQKKIKCFIIFKSSKCHRKNDITHAFHQLESRK